MVVYSKQIQNLNFTDCTDIDDTLPLESFSSSLCQQDPYATMEAVVLCL